MQENIWKWFLRLLITVAMLLLIAILVIIATNLPEAFDAVQDVGTAAERAARSVTETSNLAYDLLEAEAEYQGIGR